MAQGLRALSCQEGCADAASPQLEIVWQAGSCVAQVLQAAIQHTAVQNYIPEELALIARDWTPIWCA